MRLLQLKGNSDFSLVEFTSKNIPPYAILSHTWGTDNDEVTLKDLIKGKGKNKAGFKKILFCANQITEDSPQYFWVDTCCIDKSSSAELSEAINSMFRCSVGNEVSSQQMNEVSLQQTKELSSQRSNESSFQQPNESSSQQTWRRAFSQSRWFTRGWTLQELIAPASVEFFSVEGERLGDKYSLVQEISAITGIPIQALQGRPLNSFSVKERMSWAERRETKREEDAAYSLLGLFDVHMPLIYGEGREKAFMRLIREVNEGFKGELSALPQVFSTGQTKRDHEPFSTVPSSQDSISVDFSQPVLYSHSAIRTAGNDDVPLQRDASHAIADHQPVNNDASGISDESSSWPHRHVDMATQHLVSGGTINHSIRAGEGHGGSIVRNASGVTIGGGRATGASMSLYDLQTFAGTVEGGSGYGAEIT
ncbi:hypothetical protein N0V90_003881 [Kalmusia sp. IMI 367209]|nr:hypothetical protein N0V90_003881 [Kalmusia sp. IMI 367209]